MGWLRDLLGDIAPNPETSTYAQGRAAGWNDAVELWNSILHESAEERAKAAAAIRERDEALAEVERLEQVIRVRGQLLAIGGAGEGWPQIAGRHLLDAIKKRDPA